MYSLMFEAMLVVKVGIKLMGLFANLAVLKITGRNLGCFGRVVLIFVFTLNRLDCFGFLPIFTLSLKSG